MKQELQGLRFAKKDALRLEFLKKIRSTTISEYSEKQQLISKIQHIYNELNACKMNINLLNCQICKKIIIKMVGLNCRHCFCEQCLWNSLLNRHKCPQCSMETKGQNFYYCAAIDQLVKTYIVDTGDIELRNYYFQRLQQLDDDIQKKKISEFSIGMQLDVMDTEQIWCVGIVKSMRKGCLLIHYDGWHQIFDEFIAMNSPRLSPLGTYTSREGIIKYAPGKQDALNSRVVNSVQDDEQNDDIQQTDQQILNTQLNRLLARLGYLNDIINSQYLNQIDNRRRQRD
ncbi:hypothetical protein pb186bvf_011821 [Paramecium bursaria]